ncbi:VOC family protein [Mucilaginibacter terrae]|uniref:PhnB protein n=1 Tax=Mucilaginibacter terrae TaxID=1955052 RepID=A0ABU3GWA2_9SPHI|nr:VOC family protein [Mucilaginibacter terrae]MDT3404053.1 PhnB protein [Mucilaginibacter terrae]
MENLNIPAGYQRIMPYLIVKDAAAFFTFMQTVFGATEKMKVMRDEHTYMHAEMQIGDATIMFTDATEQFPAQNAGLFIYVADCDGTYKKATDNGASTIMPPANQDYGRSCGVLDAFGNTWWITQAV